MENKHKNEKSLARSKESLISFADILAREGVGILPGGSIAYEGIKVLIRHARKYISNRGQYRIECFHKAILQGDKSDKIMNKPFSADDYYSILSHVVRDEEDEKVSIYAKIFKALQNNVIPLDYKVHIIKSSRELTMPAYELMRKIYISNIFAFKGNESLGNALHAQIRNITQSKDPLQSYTVQNLIRLGFLYEKTELEPPLPSELLKMTVCALYDEKDLTPESIGKVVWREIVASIISLHLKGQHDSLQQLQAKLYEANIAVEVIYPQTKSFPMTSTKRILIICDDGHNQDEIDTLLNEARTNNWEKAIVLFSGADPNKYLEEKKVLFDFRTNFRAESDRLVQFITQQ